MVEEQGRLPIEEKEGRQPTQADIMALKARLEKEQKEYEQKLQLAQQELEARHQQFLQEQAAKEKLVAELNELKKEVEQLRPLSGLKEASEKKATELENRLLEVVRQRLQEKYKIDPAKLEGKSLEQLELFEEALKLAGIREASRYDTSTLPAGATSVDKIALGLEELKKI